VAGSPDDEDFLVPRRYVTAASDERHRRGSCARRTIQLSSANASWHDGRGHRI